MKKVTLHSSINSKSNIYYRKMAITLAITFAVLVLSICCNQSDKNNGKKAVLSDNNTDLGDVVRISPSHVKLVRKVDPKLSRIAMEARGIVVIEVTIDKAGKVKKARMISGHPLLEEPSLTAVRQWIYEPYTVNGIAKPARFVIAICFDF